MEIYQNKQGNSGVAAFEIRADAILVEFIDGTMYLYNEERPGRKHVRKMIRLARQGAGLSTYINQHVRDNFSQRMD